MKIKRIELSKVSNSPLTSQIGATDIDFHF